VHIGRSALLRRLPPGSLWSWRGADNRIPQKIIQGCGHQTAALLNLGLQKTLSSPFLFLT
jgi:hypothetical protein